VGNKLYVLGGFVAGKTMPVTHRCDALDLATQKWSRIADLPRGAGVNHAAVVSDGKFIYVLGGQVDGGYGHGTRACFRYDIARNTWSQFFSLPAVRFGGGAGIVDGPGGGVIHFFGGDTSDRTTTTRDHWALDLAHPEKGWVRKSSLPLGGDHLSHAVIGGQIYAIGGEHDHHGLGPVGAVDDAKYVQHKYLFRYDPKTDKWTRLADMPFGSSHNEGTTLVVNDKILVLGGLLFGDTSTNAARLYDPATDKWTVLKTPAPYKFVGAVAGYYNGRIYLTNGYRRTPPEGQPRTGWWGALSGL
jgi:N-acetylneuraminic acid mutarotase